VPKTYNCCTFMLWSRLADPFARPFKDLNVASETSGFRAVVLSAEVGMFR